MKDINTEIYNLMMENGIVCDVTEERGFTCITEECANIGLLKQLLESAGYIYVTAIDYDDCTKHYIAIEEDEDHVI